MMATGARNRLVLLSTGAAVAALGISCSRDWSTGESPSPGTSTSTASTSTTSGSGGGASTTTTSGSGGGASTTTSGSGGGPGDAGTVPDGGGGAPPEPTSRYAAAVLADAPIAYWRLGDAGGLVARDEMGGHDGHTVGNVTFGVAGAIAGDADTAARFGGALGAITIDAFDFAGRAHFTVELWLKPTNLDSRYRRVFSKEATDGNGRQGYHIYAQASSESLPLGFERWRDETRIGMALTRRSLDPSRFTHVVARYDGLTVALFIDGELVESGTSQQGILALDEPFVWGAPSSLVEDYGAQGVFDELAIYGEALASERIAAHYAAGVAPL